MIPKKFYVARVYRSSEEVLGWMIVADKEHTQAFKKSKEKADAWAGPTRYQPNKSVLDAIYVDNAPRTGFRMVTNVSRYSTSNVVWRIMHPEGFEFEITSDNLCDLLETNTIIEGEFQDPLFFTANKKLVNEKTKLFADMVKREEEKKAKEKDVTAVAVGDIIRVELDVYNNNGATKLPTELNALYCGRYHAINVQANDNTAFTSKSTLRPVIKNLADGRYYVLNKLANFTVQSHSTDEIDREVIISEVNEQIRSTNDFVSQRSYYLNYIPDFLFVTCINEKPFKFEDLRMEYREVDFSTLNMIHYNKIYRVGTDRITNFCHSYQQTSYWHSGSSTRHTNDDVKDPNTFYNRGANGTNYTLESLVGYQITAYADNGAPSAIRHRDERIQLPQTIEVGYYTL